jgi:hypothetical protein
MDIQTVTTSTHLSSHSIAAPSVREPRPVGFSKLGRWAGPTHPHSPPTLKFTALSERYSYCRKRLRFDFVSRVLEDKTPTTRRLCFGKVRYDLPISRRHPGVDRPPPPPPPGLMLRTTTDPLSPRSRYVTGMLGSPQTYSEVAWPVIYPNCYTLSEPSRRLMSYH